VSELPNIVLVHGAWADGSSWSAVIKALQAEGYNVTAAQFPETSWPTTSRVCDTFSSGSPAPRSSRATPTAARS
jgi:pimeloyl-ACP methyl ester carboxylesterase